MNNVEKLINRIEQCSFHTVQTNHDNRPGNETVYLVQQGRDIEEIGRQLIEAGSDPKGILTLLFTSQIKKVLHDKKTIPASSLRKCVIEFADIDPNRQCRVLYIPPIYLVQFV